MVVILRLRSNKMDEVAIKTRRNFNIVRQTVVSVKESCSLDMRKNSFAQKKIVKGINYLLVVLLIGLYNIFSEAYIKHFL